LGGSSPPVVHVLDTLSYFLNARCDEEGLQTFENIGNSLHVAFHALNGLHGVHLNAGVSQFSSSLGRWCIVNLPSS